MVQNSELKLGDQDYNFLCYKQTELKSAKKKEKQKPAEHHAQYFLLHGRIMVTALHLKQ